MMAWRLNDRRVLVVGGGSEAEGRIHLALNAGGNVVVIHPEVSDSIRALSDGSLDLCCLRT